jgi:hypothetical protein
MLIGGMALTRARTIGVQVRPKSGERPVYDTDIMPAKTPTFMTLRLKPKMPTAGIPLCNPKRDSIANHTGGKRSQ